MYKFKKQFENETIILKGKLIDKRSLTEKLALEILKVPSLAHRIEKIQVEIEVKELPKKIKTNAKPKSKSNTKSDQFATD